MAAVEALLVGVGAAAGGMLRFAIADAVARSAPSTSVAQVRTMWAVAAINVGGSFALGCE